MEAVIESVGYFKRLYHNNKELLKKVIDSFLNAKDVPLYIVNREEHAHRNGGKIGERFKIGYCSNFHIENDTKGKNEGVLVCDVSLNQFLKDSCEFCGHIDNFSIKQYSDPDKPYHLERLLIFYASYDFVMSHLERIDKPSFNKWKEISIRYKRENFGKLTD